MLRPVWGAAAGEGPRPEPGAASCQQPPSQLAALTFASGGLAESSPPTSRTWPPASASGATYAGVANTLSLLPGSLPPGSGASGADSPKSLSLSSRPAVSQVLLPLRLLLALLLLAGASVSKAFSSLTAGRRAGRCEGWAGRAGLAWQAWQADSSCSPLTVSVGDALAVTPRQRRRQLPKQRRGLRLAQPPAALHQVKQGASGGMLQDQAQVGGGQVDLLDGRGGGRRARALGGRQQGCGFSAQCGHARRATAMLRREGLGTRKTHKPKALRPPRLLQPDDVRVRAQAEVVQHLPLHSSTHLRSGRQGWRQGPVGYRSRRAADRPHAVLHARSPSLPRAPSPGGSPPGRVG